MRKVLIVDDKEENLYYLGTLFAGHGYTVTTAQHGAEALVKARKDVPGIIVSDLLMPVMDGYTLLRHWKADARLRHIPFVVHTATYTDAEDEDLARSLGADGFILKPCEPEVFLARIEQISARGTATDPIGADIASGNESGLMQTYSEILIRKLEHKSLQLEEANRALHDEIAERNKTETLLRLLKSAVMQSKESILITDAQIDPPGPRIVFANPAFTQLTGYGSEEVAGQSPRILQGPRTDRAVLQRLRKSLEQDEQFEGAATQYRKDGSTYEQEWQVAPIRDAGGTITHYVALQRDITERKLAETQIRESRDRLSLATQVAQIGIWDWNVPADVLLWDARMYELYGAAEEQSGGALAAWQQRLHPEDRARVEADIVAALEGTRDYDTEFRVVWPGGEVRHIKAHALLQRDDRGAPKRMIGVNWDITERKRSETRIRYLSRVHAMLSGINTLIVRVRGRDELFAGACRIAVEEGKFRMAMIATVDPATGLLEPVASNGMDEELRGELRRVLASAEDAPNSMITRAVLTREAIVSNDSTSDPRLLLPRQNADAGVRSKIVLPLIVADEAVGALVLYGSEKDLFHPEETQLLNELSRDIAFAIDHIGKQERLEYLAYYDELTGLANRTLFLDRIARHMRSSAGSEHKLALFLFDLERFRNINDSLGRAAGDALLRQVADWLTRNAGDQTLLARVDADHFAFVLPDVRPDGNLVGLVEKAMDRFVQHQFELEGNPFRIAAKAGVAVFPEDGDNADALFKNAEAALKQAKATGNRHMFYQASMNESAAARLALENQLRLALDNGEFVLHYQPKVSLATGQLTGAEALIRWNRPQVGLVPPGQFIPVLEETGLIHQVGRWALQQAIADYLRWKRAGLPVQPIAVNVSSMQLRSRGFIAEMEQLISIDPAAAAGLQLEITESMIMEDVSHGISTLRAIRAMGVTVALDDFGTGFSSLSYLSKLPLNMLKIDRSFINEMTDTPEGLSLVSSMITLAHTLNLKVVAEGVETEEQSRFLRLMRCDEMQGYLHSKPVPGDVFERSFLAHSPHA